LLNRTRTFTEFGAGYNVLGQTELIVSRLGIATGYGVPVASIEKAFH
jgi:hypothetical protein